VSSELQTAPVPLVPGSVRRARSAHIPPDRGDPAHTDIDRAADRM